MLRLTRRTRLVAPLGVLAMAAVACGSSGGGNGGGPAGVGASSTPSTAAVKDGGTLTYASEKPIANFNILTSDGNTFDTAVVLNGVFPTAFISEPDLSVQLNKDLLVSAELTNMSPETVVYKINPKAVWSDGSPISADDFTYIWQTDGGDPCFAKVAAYTAANPKGTNPPPCYTPAATVGYDSIASVAGADGGKTVTVTFQAGKNFSDWKSLFSTPTPLLEAKAMKALNPDPIKAFNTGLVGKFPKFSGGPYLVDSFVDKQQTVLKKNPMWYGAPPHLDTVIFKYVSDASQEPTGLANNELQVIYPQPQIDLVKQVDAIGSQVTSDIGFGLLFEHFDFNLANPLLKDLPVRKAIFTAVNRQQIVDATVKQFSDKASVLNSRVLLPGQMGYQDNVTPDNLGQGDTAGAMKILTDAGYKITGGKLMTPDGKAAPALKFVYTSGNAIREQEGNLLKAAVKPLGITVNVTTTDDLGGSLDGHDFDIIVFAWVGTPFPFSSSRDLYVTGGGSNYDSYSNPTVDTALKDAAVQLDTAKATDDLNTADKQLSADAVTLPLYQKPTFLAYYNKYGNINNNSTSVGPTYNIQDWGLKT